jgi:hypothetical protein
MNVYTQLDIDPKRLTKAHNYSPTIEPPDKGKGCVDFGNTSLAAAAAAAVLVAPVAAAGLVSVPVGSGVKTPSKTKSSAAVAGCMSRCYHEYYAVYYCAC